jgi:cytosine/uracil/thiamine/allantoin permease
MKTKKVIGGVLLLSPFIAIASFCIATIGVAVTAAIFAAAAAIVAVVVVGVDLVLSDE